MTWRAIPALFVVITAVAAAQAPAPPAARWFKGNLHSHTINSDGDSPPYELVTWYKSHGYQFLAITDHNTFTDPAPFDTNPNDNFLLIGAEEITNSLTVHVNAIGISRLIPQQKGATHTELLQASIDAVRAQGALPLINHPNFIWAFTAAAMLPLKSTALLEIASGHPLVNHAGDGRTPSTEQMWDELLSSGMRIHGVGVDDAHNFRQEFTRERANPGLAWVSVRAASLTRDNIIDALSRGDFYASTGVVLKDIRSTAASLEVEIETKGSATIEQSRYRVVFVGKGGRVLNTSNENPARYTFKGDEGYVRARVDASSCLRAWTQAVFLEGK